MSIALTGLSQRDDKQYGASCSRATLLAVLDLIFSFILLTIFSQTLYLDANFDEATLRHPPTLWVAAH